MLLSFDVEEDADALVLTPVTLLRQELARSVDQPVRDLVDLGGVGFTVALLIGELAFDGGSAEATLGVLLGSAMSAFLAGTILSARNAHYRSGK